jgi:hypothetical protein
MRRLDHVVLNVAANAVLRAKERCQIDIGVLMENIRCMPERFRQHRGLIANQTDTPAANEINFF